MQAWTSATKARPRFLNAGVALAHLILSSSFYTSLSGSSWKEYCNQSQTKKFGRRADNHVAVIRGRLASKSCVSAIAVVECAMNDIPRHMACGQMACSQVVHTQTAQPRGHTDRFRPREASLVVGQTCEGEKTIVTTAVSVFGAWPFSSCAPGGTRG